MVRNYRPNISLVIPVYNDSTYLRRLLNQVTVMNFKDIIVVDGASSDDSCATARQYQTVKLLMCERGRGRQISQGIAHASGEYIWILHADSSIPDGALGQIRRMLIDNNTVLGCFRLRYNVENNLLKSFAWLSRFDSPLTTFGDQGFFFRRQDIPKPEALNAWPLLEDVELRRILLRRKKGKVRKSSLALTTSARRFVHRGILKTQLMNGWILLRYYCGMDPRKLFREYYDL